MDVVESIEARWGSSVTRGAAGFTAVPSVLIRYQSELGLSSTELVVLLNVITHWWRADELPFVRPATIAKRMEVDRRTVERALLSLQEMGLVRRLPAEKSDDRTFIRRFELHGLVAALEKLAERHRVLYREGQSE